MTDKPVGVYNLLDGIINPGEKLLQWAWRQGRDGLPLRDQDDRKRGVDTHKLAELLARGGRIDRDALPDHHRHAAANLAAWWQATQPQPLGTEVKLRSPTLGISGIIDLAFACRGCPACRHRWRCPECGEASHTAAGKSWETAGAEPPVCYHPPTEERAAVALAAMSPAGGTWAHCRPDPGAWLADWKAVKRRAKIKARWHFQVGSCYRRLWDETQLVPVDERLFDPGLAARRPPTCGAVIVVLPVDDDRGPRTIQSAALPADLDAALGWQRALARVEATGASR